MRVSRNSKVVLGRFSWLISGIFCFASADEPTFKVRKSSDKEVLFQVRKKDNSPARSSHPAGYYSDGYLLYSICTLYNCIDSGRHAMVKYYYCC